MSKLSAIAKKAVQVSFPDLVVSYGEHPDPIIVVAPAHPDFGPLKVLDDEVELTVICGRFTHVHLSNYDEGITSEVRNSRVVASLIEFLRDVFADRMEFWGSHPAGGGCRLRGLQGPVSRLLGADAGFTWSGRIQEGRTGLLPHQPDGPGYAER